MDGEQTEASTLIANETRSKSEPREAHSVQYVGFGGGKTSRLKTLKIDPRAYTQDLLESKGMTSCHLTLLPRYSIAMDQVGDNNRADLVPYPRE